MPLSDDDARSRSHRWADALIGHPRVRRLALAHALDDFADALITLSLIGSLFFSVSVGDSKERVVTYLVLTAAPLAVVAPAVGPLLDRWRAGHRAVIVGSQVTRGALALGLAGSLNSVALYPFVFGVLLSRKAYTLAKPAILAQIASERDDLVAASGQLARIGTVSGGVATAVGGVIIAGVGVHWVPVVAAVAFLAACLVSSTLPVHDSDQQGVSLTARVATPSEVTAASSAVSLIRAAAGALTFLLAFAIKGRGGETWIYVAALVASGVGSFAGTMIAPRLHRKLPVNWIIVLTLFVPGSVSLFGLLTVGELSIVAIAFSIGLGGSVSSRAMDVLYGRVPQPIRGRVISRSELLFQLATLIGAVVAVVASPSPRAGFAVVGLLLLVGGFASASRARLSLRDQAEHVFARRERSIEVDVVFHALLSEAVRHAQSGDGRIAIALADAAVRAELGSAECRSTAAGCEIGDAWRALLPSIDDVLGGRAPATPDLTAAVIETAGRLRSADVDAALRAVDSK